MKNKYIVFLVAVLMVIGSLTTAYFLNNDSENTSVDDTTVSDTSLSTSDSTNDDSDNTSVVDTSTSDTSLSTSDSMNDDSDNTSSDDTTTSDTHETDDSQNTNKSTEASSEIKETEPKVTDTISLVDFNMSNIKLFVGQDNDSINDYVNCGKFKSVDGITLYTSIYDLYGLDENADWGAGRTNIKEAVNKHRYADLAIGLSMVEGQQYQGGLAKIAAGNYDSNIDALGEFAKTISPRKIFLRIGYEFDGPWNAYNQKNYISAYKHIKDRLDANGINNIEYVWQSYSCVFNYGMQPPIKWYPGDDYVDYVGVSYFGFAGNQSKAASNLNNANALQIARKKGKPVMMAEVSAQYYQFDQNTFHKKGSSYFPTNNGIEKKPEMIWNEFFSPLFTFIKENNDIIKVVAWINADWDSQPMWAPPYASGYWGDTRIQTNKYLTDMWNKQWN